MAAPTNDVSQYAPSAEVSTYLTGPPLRTSLVNIAKIVARFKTNAQDPVRQGP